MAKDKDRAQNPAAQQRKLEKQKALKKSSSLDLHMPFPPLPLSPAAFTDKLLFPQAKQL